MESEEGVEFAERVETAYTCPVGHTIIVPFALEADIPPMWHCRCGNNARLGLGEDGYDGSDEGRGRTHWDMLLERRSVEELEDLLQERLTLLRDRRGTLASAAS